MNAQEFLLQFAKAQAKAGKHADPIAISICTVNLEDYYNIIAIRQEAGSIIIDVDVTKPIT